MLECVVFGFGANSATLALIPQQSIQWSLKSYPPNAIECQCGIRAHPPSPPPMRGMTLLLGMITEGVFTFIIGGFPILVLLVTVEG